MSVINLNLVRLDREREQVTRSKRAYKIAETRRKQNMVKERFLALYEEFTGIRLELEKKRYVSYFTNGKLIKKHLNSDKKRLWDIYCRSIDLYKATDEEFASFLRWALKKAFIDIKIDKVTKIIGYVTANKTIDEYFFKKRSKEIVGSNSNKKLKNMAKKHAEYFDE